MKRQKKGLIFIFMLALCSGILTLKTWNSLERNDLMKEPTEVQDEQFYIDCLEKLTKKPISAGCTSDLKYSTYIGGNHIDSEGAIAVGADGSVYITGYTYSTDFPTTSGAFDEGHYGGGIDAFACKLSADGSTLVYSTFIGGDDYDYGKSIAVDIDGCIYITGYTFSADFPTTTGAYDETINGGSYSDAFICKLSADGSTLIYSTFIGGSNVDRGYSIAVDAGGSAYITGYTDSSGFPTTTGAFDETHNGGSSEAFICKLSADGSTLVYSTFIGGSDWDNGESIAVDSDGYAYITGHTMSINFNTTTGAFDETYNGGFRDVFTCKLSADGSTLNYSTFIGGSDDDRGYSIAIGIDGSAYITGYTESSNFNTTNGAFDETYNEGNSDVIVCKLSADGSTLVYSTFIGGINDDYGYSIAVGSDGSACITGSTNSGDFPTTPGAFDEVHNDMIEPDQGFVSKLSADGSTLIYSTFIGGADGFNWGSSIAIGTDGSVYITGYTDSEDFPITSGAYDEEFEWDDVFICKFIFFSAECDDDTPQEEVPDFFIVIVLIGILSAIGIIITKTLLIKKRKQSTSREGNLKKEVKSNANKSQYYRNDSIMNERSQFLEEQQPYYPPMSLKIGVYCASCHDSHSITRDQFETFSCRRCGHYFFNVGYFCRNCNQIYPISRDDFINLQEPEVVRCFKCNSVAEISKSEQ